MRSIIEDDDSIQYMQCQLDRGNEQQVAWIPVAIAKQGLRIRFRDSAGGWDSGWVVTQVYGSPRSGRTLNRHDTWRRKNTHGMRQS